MVTLEKNEVRRLIRECRKKVLPWQKEEWDKSILEKLLDRRQIRQAFCVYCFVSMPEEPETRQLIKILLNMGKYVVVPRITGKRMEFFMIDGMGCLEPGTMGILEPKADCIKICEPKAPVIVPGLAFDREGARIGYGGGYYDRFLQAEPLHGTIGICYDFQLFDKLETEPHDQKLKLIITP